MAAIASRTLDDRPVHVELWDPSHPEQVHSAGGPAAEHTVSEDVCIDDGTVGRIHVGVGRDGWWTESDRRVLASVVNAAAMAAQTQIRRRERDAAQHATIFGLARLAEQRDNETGRHLERVSSYCRLVAESLRARGVHAEAITDEFSRTSSAPLPCTTSARSASPTRSC